jgi:AraC-like DNA-binding protein
MSLYFWGNSSRLGVTLPKSDVVLVHFCLRGAASLTSGSYQVEIGRGEAFVYSRERDAQLEFGAGLEQIILRIPLAMLERSLEPLIGFKPRHAISFEPAIDPADPHYAGFRELVMMLAGGLDPALSAWPQATLAQLEQACVTSFLHCSRHNFRRFLGAAPADDIPVQILHAEHYVESQCGADITVAGMAEIAGVSVSTLTRAFLKHRGFSPATFIKRAKLSRARTLLETGAATTVVGVALRCGFANPSRFANDYRQAFGESPTEALRRRADIGPKMQKY